MSFKSEGWENTCVWSFSCDCMGNDSETRSANIGAVRSRKELAAWKFRLGSASLEGKQTTSLSSSCPSNHTEIKPMDGNVLLLHVPRGLYGVASRSCCAFFSVCLLLTFPCWIMSHLNQERVLSYVMCAYFWPHHPVSSSCRNLPVFSFALWWWRNTLCCFTSICGIF